MEDKIHNFGPWTPARFVPVPFLPGAPAWFITTARICRGIHDERCAHGETQTFGPLTAVGTTAAEVFVCARCHREQPPVNEHAT
ncbi:hypothetical protein, partial [Streptomyces sp. NBC_00470]|uniref:hypothetical protein n=1 Tax=Streptomyces sp. NBC_00470 TaxID=2975753 RepID=UPI00352C4FCE